MSASVLLKERDVRRVVSVAVNTALAVPQYSWSADFVVETIMAEITTTITATNTSNISITEALAGSSTADICSSNSNTNEVEPQAGVGSSNSTSESESSKRQSRGSKNSNSSSKAGNSGRVATWADGVHGASPELEVMLAPAVVELLDMFHEAADDAAGQSHFTSHDSSRGTHRRSDPDGKVQQQPQQQQQQHELQTMLSQLVYDNYQQVDDDDVNAFCHKLMTDLHYLVQQALEEQSEDMQGLCALCGRDMPLTKHHLVPRDVHKEYKKRGFTFDQLQSGIYVCRPCHSAIHRTVPDNKELAMHYRTLEDLRQHEAINKFTSWASKQRVSSKADTSAKHFKYRK